MRTLRRRRGWRQRDLAAASRLSQTMISLLERGHVEQASLRTLRRVLLTLEARGELEIRWRGGHLDRLLDERHAALVGGIVTELTSLGWVTAVEVTYARFGERGSIDVLAYRPDRTSLLVVEVKSELTSIEEVLRQLDQKVRLGPTVAAERLGWVTRSTSRLLVLPESTAAREGLSTHAAVLDAAFPVRGLVLRRWLRDPQGTCSGVRLLRLNDPRADMRRRGGSHRVRTPRSLRGGRVPSVGTTRDRVIAAHQGTDRSDPLRKSTPVATPAWCQGVRHRRRSAPAAGGAGGCASETMGGWLDVPQGQGGTIRTPNAPRPGRSTRPARA